MRPISRAVVLLSIVILSLIPARLMAQQTAGATATIFNGFVVDITVTNGGSGYSFAPAVTITGGGGSGAVAFSAISNGAVISISVTNAGNGYTSVPQVIVDAPSSFPIGASLAWSLPINGSVVDTGPNQLVVTNNGTLSTNRFGQPASAVSLNGINQVVALPYNALVYPTEFTLSIWVRFQQFSGCAIRSGNAQADSHRGFALEFGGDQNVYYSDYTGGSGGSAFFPISTTNFVIGGWSQLVITRATNVCVAYINGARIAFQTNLVAYAKPQTTPLNFGANQGPNYYSFTPMGLDSVRMYNRPLSESEVQALYTAESTPGTPLQIVSQPVSQTVSAGTNVTFNVGVTSDTPVSYQWQLNGVNIAGAIGNTLNLTNVQAADEGGYRVILGNTAGTTNSVTALLRVNPAIPTITLGPTNQTLPAATDATFSVVAIGSIPLTYQWRINSSPLPGATNASLILSNIQGFNNGTYSVLVSNAYGFASSTGAVLVVTPTAPIIIKQPTNQTVLAGSSTSFSVTVAGSVPFTYQWRYFGSNIIGATSSNLPLNNVQFASAGEYSVAVSNLVGGVISSNAVLSVYSPPVITNLPASQTFFAGTNVSFQAGVLGSAPLAYQWYFNGFKLAGKTNTSLALTNVQSFDAGNYTVVVTNVYGSATSNSVLIIATRPSSVIAWADNGGGQTDVPTNLANIIAVAGGNFHSLALRSNGIVVGWGFNGFSQAQPPAGLNNVTAIAAGDIHSLALKSDGKVVAWGDNGYGQTNPPGNLSNVTAIAAGALHNLALTRDGTVTGWGATNYNQVTPPVGLSNVVAIAAGEIHNLALKNDGTVVAWGNNGYGQLDKPSNLTNVVAISAGYFHSMALRKDRTVVCWGDDTYGQSATPDGLSNVVAIAAGEIHSIALLADGTVVGWGDDAYGQTKIPDDVSNVVAIASGYYHNLALTLNPFILSHPASVEVTQNAPASFNVGAGGVGPHRFQWRFNGVDISGQTNSSLSILNVQPENVGTYSVTVANPYASLVSSNATLTVTSFQFGSGPDNVLMTSTGFWVTVEGIYAPNAVVIFASTNLVDWKAIYTNPPVTGTFQFLDPSASNFPIRFYRALEE